MSEIKSQNKVLYLISIIGFFGIFSGTISKNPVLPLFAQSLGASTAIIGLIAAISPIAGILFSFPVGYLCDSWGRKKLLLVSALVFLISPLLYLLITNPLLLIPVRFFHGIATAILGPVASSIIFSNYTKDRGEKIGLYSSATLVGRTVAPIVGGFLMGAFVYMGILWSYKVVYIAAFVVSIPVLFLCLMYKEEGVQSSLEELKKTSFTQMKKALLSFIGNAKLLATGLAEMATYFSFGAFETYFPIYLHYLGVSPAKIGMAFSLQILSIALTKPLFGKLSDHIDRRVQIIFGLLILGSAIAAMPAFSNFIMLLVCAVIFGFGMSFCTVATSAYSADVAKAEELGASMGALSSIMDIGHSSGPFVAGVIISLISLKAGFLACGIVCVLSAGFFIYSGFQKNLDKPITN